MLAAQRNLVQRPRSWKCYIHRRNAVQEHKESFWDNSRLGFCTLANKSCLSRVPVGLDLVLHWIGYTICGSGDTFTGLCSFAPMGSGNSPPSPSSTAEAHGHVYCQKLNTALERLAVWSVMAIATRDFIPRNTNVCVSVRKRTKPHGISLLLINFP